MKHYFITSELLYKNGNFKQNLAKILNAHKIDFICLRDKENKNYESIARQFLKLSSEFNFKAILHTNVNLTKELNAFGVHLPSNLLGDIKFAKKLGLFTFASVHNLEEALFAQSLNADAVCISPVFFVENKAKPLGLVKLKEITDKINIKCYALGGIKNQEQIKSLEQMGIDGFAAIRYFLKEDNV